MEHDARTVANKIIDLSLEDGKPLTPLQIIKLVYFCHGWMLGLYGRSLITEYVHAWRYGPVIPNVYHALKRYGGEPVTERIARAPEEAFDDLEEDLIEQVYEGYSDLTGIQLSQLTHAEGTPWHEVWNETGSNSIIPDELIKEHYRDIMADQEK